MYGGVEGCFALDRNVGSNVIAAIYELSIQFDKSFGGSCLVGRKYDSV